jgi:Arm DNA-binding domain
MKLTASIIDTLECRGKAETTYFDDSMPGFGLRLRKTGIRRWVVCYEDAAGESRRYTIGDPAIIGIDEARKVARTKLAEVRLGGDPQAKKAEQRKAARHTLGAVIDEYLAANQVTLWPLTVQHLRRYMRDWWKPLHRTPISKLHRRDIAPYLNGTAAAAGRARSCLMTCCKWAIEQGYIDANPVIGTGRPDKDLEPRSRVLSLRDNLARLR